MKPRGRAKPAQDAPTIFQRFFGIKPKPEPTRPVTIEVPSVKWWAFVCDTDRDKKNKEHGIIDSEILGGQGYIMVAHPPGYVSMTRLTFTDDSAALAWKLRHG